MARICAFVFNPAIRDARVIKQANSLAAQGHDVTVIGLCDNNHTEERVRLKTGVEIRRVPRDTVGGASSSSPSLWRKLLGHNFRLLLLPFILIYLAWIGVSEPLDVKIERLIDFAIVCALAAGVVYLLANLASLVRAVLLVLMYALRSVLGAARADRARSRMADLFRRSAPRQFEQEIERRSRVRIDRMVEIALALEPDVVHCHDIHTLPAGAKMKAQTGCKVVYDAHEIYEEIAQGNPDSARRYRRMHEEFLPCIDGFVTINESIAGWYRENYPQIPEPVVVMNATIRTPPFRYDGRLHKAVGLSAKDKILLYQGGFARKRGLEYLVEAAAFLPPDWTLAMMGWGRLESELRATGERINASRDGKRKGNAVHFLPPAPQEDLPYWSAGATVGVIPYENVGLNHWFCTPNKLWEYPNAGVPVLVSPFPELRKPVEEYRYGWLLPQEQDPRKLADLVARLDGKEIARASKACATFSNKENWSKYEARLLALYENIANGAAATAVPAIQPALSS